MLKDANASSLVDAASHRGFKRLEARRSLRVLVERPAERLGTRAAQLLISRSREGGSRTEQRIVLESQIVLRHSHWGRSNLG